MEKPLLTDDFVFSYMMGSSGSELALKSFIDAVQKDSGRMFRLSALFLWRPLSMGKSQY